MNKKLIAVISMVLVAVLCVVGAQWLAPMPAFSFTGGNDTPVVMKIDNKTIHAAEYAAFVGSIAHNYESQMAQFGADTSKLWDDGAMVESVRHAAEEMLKQCYAITFQFKKDGLHLSRNELHEMQKDKWTTIQSMGGPEEFTKALETQGMSMRMYDNMMILNRYAQKLNEYYFGKNGKLAPSEQELETYYADHYIQAKHVLISTKKEDGTALSDKEKAEKKKLAEEIAKRAKTEDFDALVEQYGEDPGMKGNKEGYTFTEGQMVTPFYEGAKALQENQTSGVIESDFGYHIIKRLPLDKSKMGEYRDSMVQAVTGKTINDLYREWMDALSIDTVQAEIEKITPQNAMEIASKMDTKELIVPKQ